jgi:hypothetical protein
MKRAPSGASSESERKPGMENAVADVPCRQAVGMAQREQPTILGRLLYVSGAHKSYSFRISRDFGPGVA